MQTVRNNREVQTQLSDDDRTKLGRIVTLFGPLVEPDLEPIGRYHTMILDELWLALVEEVCVMGSARPIERLQKDDLKKYEKFQEAVSVESLSRQQDHLISYLSNTLHDFRAARFYNRSSERIASMFKSSEVFQRGELVLLRGLSHEGVAIQTRDELIRRNPIFGLKSASDFMISVGLSHDVIALDTRVVGVFRDHFGYNITPGRIQSSRDLYLSLEATLREFCYEQGVSLALLDRLLFKFNVLSAIELIVKYPELARRFG
jgi:thermostable 8-oxoguanine DNA glycosylase